MLARVAETLYWIARDVERAAAIARALEIGHAASLEGTFQNGAGRTHIWEPVLSIVGDPASFLTDHRRADERSVSWYLTLSEANPDSVIACLGRARTRIRSIRSRLPTELFEVISSGDITSRAWTAQRLSREGLFAFCHQVRGQVAAVDGIVDRAVRRDEHWQFLRLGRHLERAIQVSRLLSVHTGLIAVGDERPQGIGDWRTLLRLASSYEAYLRVALPGRNDGPTPVAFLLLDRQLPSSVMFCLDEVGAGIAALRSLSTPSPDVSPKAAVFAASRAAASAARTRTAEYGLGTLQTRLTDIHEAVASIFLPDAEVASGPLYAQAVRQAQN
jgi:uncharacterized alpha-E superfamily protein